MSNLNYSRQREFIKEYLKSRKDHPTAEMVYHAARQQFEKISLGTVYRNLTLLAEQGEIQKISCGEESDRFDGNTLPHYHFYCRECSSVGDLEMPSIQHIDILAGNGFKGVVQGHVAYFYGVCENCRLKKEKEVDI